MSTRQLTIEDVAFIWGIKPRSVSGYLSRGQMPAPDGRTGRTPWWHESTITGWTRPGKGTRTDLRPTPDTRTGAALPAVVWVHAQGASDYLWGTVTAAVSQAGAVVVKHRTDLWHLARGGCPAWEVDMSPGGRDVLIRSVRARHGDDGALQLVTTGDHSIDTPIRYEQDATDQMGRPGAMVLDAQQVAQAVNDALTA